ncbi:DUF951 domain-containing protein, partial [Chloroflexota bacterium]
ICSPHSPRGRLYTPPGKGILPRRRDWWRIDYGLRLTPACRKAKRQIKGLWLMETRPGDVVRLKKKHPCGGDEWLVTRVGADIGLKCLKCQRHTLLKRGAFERRVKNSREAWEERDMDSNREKELEIKLAELKERWPAHSVPAAMWRELEDLEEELARSKAPPQGKPGCRIRRPWWSLSSAARETAKTASAPR